MKTILFLFMFLQLNLYGNFKDATNGEWVTVAGTVTSVSSDAFKLKSKDRIIYVEMDDYHWDADGYKVVKGDQVIVTGKIDQDFYEKKKIEAGSVYVRSLKTYFYASSDDEEDFPYLNANYYSLVAIPENTSVDLKGRVSAIDGRKFILDTGIRKVTIDTSKMAYNPMDKVGFLKIRIGQRLRVSGLVENKFFGGQELEATFIQNITPRSI